jgi:hypothetical protein
VSGITYDYLSYSKIEVNHSVDFDSTLPRMSHKGGEISPQSAELHDGPKSYVPPFVQDEYNDEERPTRMPSPPMSEPSNPPSTEQHTVLSDEVIAELTERIKKEGEFGLIVCKFRNSY